MVHMVSCEVDDSMLCGLSPLNPQHHVTGNIYKNTSWHICVHVRVCCMYTAVFAGSYGLYHMLPCMS